MMKQYVEDLFLISCNCKKELGTKLAGLISSYGFLIRMPIALPEKKQTQDYQHLLLWRIWKQMKRIRNTNLQKMTNFQVFAYLKKGM